MSTAAAGLHVHAARRPRQRPGGGPRPARREPRGGPGHIIGQAAPLRARSAQRRAGPGYRSGEATALRPRPTRSGQLPGPGHRVSHGARGARAHFKYRWHACVGAGGHPHTSFCHLRTVKPTRAHPTPANHIFVRNMIVATSPHIFPTSAHTLNPPQQFPASALRNFSQNYP